MRLLALEASLAILSPAMVAARGDPLASSDEEVEMPDVDLAELMGTPPTRKGRPQGFGKPTTLPGLTVLS